MHSRSFVIRWAHVKPGYSLQWQIRPLKKSVSFGVFQHQAVDDRSAAKDIHMADGSISQRLASNGFRPIEQIRRIQANEDCEGHISVTSGQLIALVIDNTFSHSTSKTVQVSFSTSPAGSDLSPSSDLQVKVSEIRRRRSTLVSVDRNPEVSQDGRLFTGPLLKKRRKNFQGYGRRYFVLDMKLGLLKYYLNEKSSYLRGVMPLKIADMDLDEASREITVDSGVERWHLRALDDDGFNHWISVFEAVRSARSEIEDESHDVSKMETNETESIASKSLFDTNGLQEALSKLRKSIDDLRSQDSSLDLSNLESVYQSLDRVSPEGYGKGSPSEGSQSSTPRKLSLVKPKHEKIKSKKKQDTEGGLTEYRQAPLMGWKEPLTGGCIGFLGLFLVKDYIIALTGALIGLLIGLLISIKIRLPPSAAESLSLASIASNIGTQDSDTDEGSSSDSEKVLEPQHTHFVPQRPQGHAFPKIGEEDVNKEGLRSAEGDKIDRDQYVGSDESVTAETNFYPLPHEKVTRREAVNGPIDAPPSVLSIMRRAAGKDLSHFAAPVSTNEPISALQRVAEIYESSELLDEAARAPNSRERVMMVAVFAVSHLASTRCKERCLRKPFTPLLGESYEMVREDMGFRFVSEKVIHKPLVIASQAESALWTVHYTSRPLQKLWAKTVQLTDSGPIRVTFFDGESITFIGPEMFIRNILAGEKYVEAVGSIQVESSSGEVANVEFKSGGMFSGRSEEVKIVSQSDVSCVFEGSWTSSICRIVDGKPGDILWSVKPMVNDPSKHYGWTRFTAELNEVTELETGKLPPNDSRLRPDIRLLEKQKTEEAEGVKNKLEQWQRDRRKKYELEKRQWEPQYFTQSDDVHGFYVLNSGKRNYWVKRQAKDWDEIKEIFSNRQ